MSKVAPDQKKLIIYDGVCVLCSNFIRWVYNRNSARDIYFTTMQSNYGKKIAKSVNIHPDNFDTIIYIENGIAYFKSDAIIHICSSLKQPWSTLRVGYAIFPQGLRNFFYDVIASNRYKLFGKSTECIIPDKQLVNRLIK